MTAIYLPAPATCGTCDFTTQDTNLLAGHSCDVQSFGGRCEDYPCCGHALGDCNGALYGSDEAIKAEVHRMWDTGHGYCDHAEGIYQCDGYADFGDADPDTCDHDDYSFTTVERDGVEWDTKRRCDNCWSDLPDVPSEV